MPHLQPAPQPTRLLGGLTAQSPRNRHVTSFPRLLQVVRYEPGQFYRVHHDQNSGHFTPQGARVYTFFMWATPRP